MGQWKVEYYFGTEWLEKSDATFDKVIEALDGHEEATFLIPNTEDNRSFVQINYPIRFMLGLTEVYRGVLYGVEYTVKALKCIVYNDIYEQLKRRVMTPCSYGNVPANEVAEDVRVAAGIPPLGSCPTDPISINFDYTLCYDAIEQIAKILNADFWTSAGVLYIGDRGQQQEFDNLLANVSSRQIDRVKKRDKVYVRGMSESGAPLLGEAGEGDNVAVFWFHNSTSEATLDALAEQKLWNECMYDDSSVVLTVPITSGEHLHPGDEIYVSKIEFYLLGYYRIRKATKYRKTVDIEITRKKKSTEDVLEQLVKDTDMALSFAGKGGGYGDPLVAVLQFLVGLYHLDEGTGTVAKDSSPRDLPVNGTITGATWTWSSVTKILSLTFDGDDNVNIGNSITLAGGNFTVGLWCIPSAHGGYLLSKANQFSIESMANGVLRFNFYDSGGLKTFDSDEGAVTLGEKNFIMYTFDQGYLTLYVNGNLAKTFNQVNPLTSSSADILFGSGYQGTMAEVMFWLRKLSPAEVAELYFFPLARVVSPDRYT